MAIDPASRVGKHITCICGDCGRATNHTILACHRTSGTTENGEIQYWCSHLIVQCDGCDRVGFRLEESNTEDFDPRTDECIVRVRYFPSVRLTGEGAPYLRNEVYHMPGIVQQVYLETRDAITADLSVLAGVGIRAIVEAVCRDKQAGGKDLAKMIDDLVKKSLLTPDGADILHSIRLLGNDAAHQMRPPTDEQIAAAMKVVDHLLIGAYVLPKERDILPKRGAAKGTIEAKAAIHGVGSADSTPATK